MVECSGLKNRRALFHGSRGFESLRLRHLLFLKHRYRSQHGERKFLGQATDTHVYMHFFDRWRVAVRFDGNCGLVFDFIACVVHGLSLGE